MPGPVSIYLREGTLRKLNAAVELRAQKDRDQGRTGRQVTNRSAFLERIIEEYLDTGTQPTVDDIRYHVVSLAEKYRPAKVSLFGSYARNEPTHESDIDILLEKGGTKGLQVLDFGDELAQRLGRPVDIVTTAGASERFLKKIRADEVVLYEAL